MQPLEKWVCDECGELHDDEDDARECCQPLVREVYQCPICSEHYYRKVEAMDCIEECESNQETKAYMASKEELEMQGQQRLL